MNHISCIFTGAPERFIAGDGQPFHSSKSAILDVIESPVPMNANSNHDGNHLFIADAYIVDLSVEIRSKASKFDCAEKTYEDFVLHVLNCIADKARKLSAKQIDLVADFYNQLSVKSATRAGRGTASRVAVELTSKLPTDFNDRLSNSDFKRDLNDCFSSLQVLIKWKWQGDFVVTKRESIIERLNGAISQRQLCFSGSEKTVLEESDNRMVLHVKDNILLRDNKKLVIRSSDSDVVIIMISFMTQFIDYSDDVSVKIDFGSRPYRRFIDVNSCYDHVGESIALALPFFHALSGCDSTTSFYRKSKVNLFNAWMNSSNYHSITEVFQMLSWQPSQETLVRCFVVLEAYIAEVYGSKQSVDNLNLLRWKLFKASSSNNIRELPPTTSSLHLHVLRAAFQAGWIWGNSVSQEPCPDAQTFGWKINNNVLCIQWCEQSHVQNADKLFKLVTNTCKCSSKPSPGKCKSCSCSSGELKLSCLNMCKCTRSCV